MTLSLVTLPGDLLILSSQKSVTGFRVRKHLRAPVRNSQVKSTLLLNSNKKFLFDEKKIDIVSISYFPIQKEIAYFEAIS